MKSQGVCGECRSLLRVTAIRRDLWSFEINRQDIGKMFDHSRRNKAWHTCVAIVRNRKKKKRKKKEVDCVRIMSEIYHLLSKSSLIKSNDNDTWNRSDKYEKRSFDRSQTNWRLQVHSTTNLINKSILISQNYSPFSTLLASKYLYKFEAWLVLWFHDTILRLYDSTILHVYLETSQVYQIIALSEQKKMHLKNTFSMTNSSIRK